MQLSKMKDSLHLKIRCKYGIKKFELLINQVSYHAVSIRLVHNTKVKVTPTPDNKPFWQVLLYDI